MCDCFCLRLFIAPDRVLLYANLHISVISQSEVYFDQCHWHYTVFFSPGVTDSRREGRACLKSYAHWMCAPNTAEFLRVLSTLACPPLHSTIGQTPTHSCRALPHLLPYRLTMSSMLVTSSASRLRTSCGQRRSRSSTDLSDSYYHSSKYVSISFFDEFN